MTLEYHRPVYRDSSDNGAFYGNGTAARSMGGTAVVGEGGSRPIPGGIEGNGEGDRVGYGGRCRGRCVGAEGKCGIWYNMVD